MADLSEFLLARIAEDEKYAWDFERDPETRLPRFWLDRLTAECGAKRRIVNLAQDTSATTALMRRSTASRADLPKMDAATTTLRMALQCLALPYADHPDYDPEWKV